MSGDARTIVMTGATSGIGEVAALRLAAQGDRIVFIARDEGRAQSLLRRLRAANPRADHTRHLADLTEISAMRDVARAIHASEPRIDVLINNAGAVFMRRTRTADGLSPSFATNHLAYYVITLMLLDRLKAAGNARIVCTASRAHRFGHLNFDQLQIDGIRGYAMSKLANLLFVRHLARMLRSSGVTINALHPGFVATRFADNSDFMWRTLMQLRKRAHGRTPEQGARTLLYLADSTDVAGQSGLYFADCHPTTPSVAARDDTAAERLWDLSARLTGVALNA